MIIKQFPSKQFSKIVNEEYITLFIKLKDESIKKCEYRGFRFMKKRSAVYCQHEFYII